MAVALPIELVVNHHALGRADDAPFGRQEIAGQGPGVGIDQPGLRVEAVAPLRFVRAVGLEMVKLARPHAGHENAPDVSPAVQVGVEINDIGRFRIPHVFVEQHPHRGGTAAENDKLHAAVVDDRPVRKGVRKS